MAPTIAARVPSPESIRYLTKSLSSLSIRDTASSTTPLSSVFALVLTSSSKLSRRAITSLSDLPTERSSHAISTSPQHHSALLAKRQQAILVIPTTYANLNSGPSPGAVVGIVLGSVFGFILCLYILLLSIQFWGYGFSNTTVVKEEVIIDKRTSKSKSRSRSKSHKSVHSSHHSEHEHISIVAAESPPPPPRSRRETIIEIEEEIVRRRSPSPRSLSPEEVVVMEEDDMEETILSEEIVEVIEEQSSIVSPSPEPRPAPPSRKPSNQNRRSGFRTVDPAEFGGGERPMRRVNRRP